MIMDRGEPVGFSRLNRGNHGPDMGGHDPGRFEKALFVKTGQRIRRHDPLALDAAAIRGGKVFDFFPEDLRRGRNVGSGVNRRCSR